MQITSKSFWLPLNQSSPNSVVDAISNAAISIPKGSAVAINCAAFRGSPAVSENLVNDLTNITCAKLSIFKTNALGALLYSGTVAFADFNNPSCSFANFNTQQDFQFGFKLTSDETNWTLGSGWNGAIWFSIEVLTTNGPVILGIGTGSVFATGDTAGETVVNNPTYLTAAQIAAAYDALGTAATARAAAIAAAQAYTNAAVPQFFANSSDFPETGVTGVLYVAINGSGTAPALYLWSGSAYVSVGKEGVLSLGGATGAITLGSGLSISGGVLSSSGGGGGGSPTGFQIGLEAYWTLNNTLVDATGNGNLLALVGSGSAFITDPVIGGGVKAFSSCDSSSVFRHLVSSSVFCTGPWSLRLGFLLNTGVGLPSYPSLFQTNSGAPTSHSVQYVLGSHGGGDQATNRLNWNNSGLFLGTDQAPTTGVWHQILLTFDPTLGLSWYLDDASALVYQDTSWGDLTFAALVLGAGVSGGCNALLKEVGLWNLCFSSSDALSLWNSGTLLTYSQLSTSTE